MKLRKMVLISIVAMAVAAPSAFAEWRADFGVDVPWKLGATVSGILGASGNASVDVLSNFTFLLPDVFLGYQFGLGPVSLGVGGRLFTFLVETVTYPAAFAEVNLGPIALNLNVGGGVYLWFGLFNYLGTAPLIIPDLNAAFKLGKTFRIGIGTAAFLTTESNQQIFPYVVYISGKFVVKF